MAALTASLALALAHAVPFPARSILYDYRAFACAGQTVDRGADPYRAEPLRTCEHLAGPFRKDLAELAVPAPLPGYALAPFTLLARLPAALGSAIWVVLSLCALAAAVFALARTSGIRASIVFAALLLGDGYLSISLGQLVPIALGALCLAALALQRERYVLAAVCAAVAALEPHIALGPLLALALFVPRARLPLGILAALGAALSLLLLGFGLNLEYVQAVLPAHALSELANEEQYSLAYALHALGLSDAAALRVADVSYLITLIAGLATVRALLRRGAPVALAVVVPAAFALVGGPFVHVHQMAFALPAALVAFGSFTRERRTLATAIVLLAVPWGTFVQLLSVLPLLVFVAGLLTYELFGGRGSRATRATRAALAGTCAALFVTGLAFALVPRPEAAAALAAVSEAGALAEVSWRAYIETSFHANAAVFGVAKIPTLAGLAALLYAVLRAAFAQHESRGALA